MQSALATACHCGSKALASRDPLHFLCPICFSALCIQGQERDQEDMDLAERAPAKGGSPQQQGSPC